MIEYGEEKYITASEVARRLKISPRTCSINVVPTLTKCYLPGRKFAMYKQSDVEQLSQVRTVERQVQPLTFVKQDSSEDELLRAAL